jgi:hypothetical protein
MDGLSALFFCLFNVKASRETNQKLMELSMSMSATIFARRHVVEIKYPLNLKWNMVATLDKSKVSSGVINFGKFKNSAMLK